MTHRFTQTCLAMAVVLLCAKGLFAVDARESKTSVESGISPGKGSASYQTWAALNRPLTIEADSVPLKYLVEQIADQVEVTIEIEKRPWPAGESPSAAPEYEAYLRNMQTRRMTP